jgi:hypothetical protein
MYHPVNEPEACIKPLERLMGLAHETLRFGLENDSAIGNDFAGAVPPQVGLASRLSDIFPDDTSRSRFLAAVRAGFLEHFRTQGELPAGKWLWRKRAAIAAPLVRLILIPKDKKQGIREAFEDDIKLRERFRDGQFRYLQLSPTCGSALIFVKQILEAFYDDILAEDGVSEDIIQDVFPLNRQSVLWAFVRANPELHVCPACDGDPPALTGHTILADCDHFFPKTKYPFLSIHPLNLSPFCEKCNQRLKGTKDVLTDIAGIGSLQDIYHPYLCPARDDIKVNIERDPADDKPHVRLRAKANDAQHLARLRSLDLVSLQSHWDGEITLGNVQAKLNLALTYATQDLRDQECLPSGQWFTDKLRLIARDMDMATGTDTRLVATRAYTEWIVSDERAWQERYAQYLKWHRTSTGFNRAPST